MDNQNVDFAYPWKIFAEAHVCIVCVYNLRSALYFAINNHLCVIRIPFVSAFRLACQWMCDSPRTGYARRLTTIYMWRLQPYRYIYFLNVCGNVLGDMKCFMATPPVKFFINVFSSATLSQQASFLDFSAKLWYFHK